MPDVPAFAEQAAPGYDFSSWLGIVTTGGTPASIVNKLRNVLVRVGNSTDVGNRLADEGTVMVLNTPEQFRNFIETEMVR